MSEAETHKSRSRIKNQSESRHCQYFHSRLFIADAVLASFRFLRKTSIYRVNERRRRGNMPVVNLFACGINDGKWK